MRVLVVGAGVVGSVYAARLLAAGHEVSVLARGSRLATLEQSGLRVRAGGTDLTVRPGLVGVGESLATVDLTVVAVRATQLDSVLGLLGEGHCPVVAFLQHLGPHAEEVRTSLGSDRTVLAFPGIGGLMREDGSVEYVEIGAQPTTIDATAPRAAVLADAIASTSMATTLEPDMDAWFATHTVFVACLGAGILSCGGDAAALAADAERLRCVVAAVHEGFAVLRAQGITVTPRALSLLFSRLPHWVAVAYWRRTLRGPVGTLALAPHSRASRDDEFGLICTTVLDTIDVPTSAPTLVELLSPYRRPRL